MQCFRLTKKNSKNTMTEKKHIFQIKYIFIKEKMQNEHCNSTQKLLCDNYIYTGRTRSTMKKYYFELSNTSPVKYGIKNYILWLHQNMHNLCKNKSKKKK